MTDNGVLFVRSSKKNGNASTEEESCSPEDIWDDTLLIKAYDKAVQIAQESYTKKKQNADESLNSRRKKGSELKWKTGDKCRCQYSQDLKYYEADIIEILSSTGMCKVRYVGYENEEKIPLKKLKPSKGEAARARQIKEAAEDNEDHNDMDVETAPVGNSAEKTRPVQKKLFNSKKGGHLDKKNGFGENKFFNSLNFPLPQMENSIIPPPPPPHMFNRLSEDENETEAMSAMLISWYMSGYHTGYYQGLKMAKKQ